VGVPQIDLIINAFEAERLPHQRPVIEITSGTTGSGKTHLLYYLTAAAVLPTGRTATTHGGGGTVVVLDADGRFDVARLAQVIKTLLLKHQADAQFLGEAVMNALRHVHIFRPQSLQSLVETVQRLPNYLLSPTAGHSSSERSLDLLLLDSASAFFWQEKMTEESARFDGDANAINHPRSTDSKFSQLVGHLRAVQSQFECSVIATNWGLSPAPNQSMGSSFKSFMPPVWQSYVTLRLILERNSVTKFPATMSVEQAVRDAPARQAAVDEGKFTARVEVWGDEQWRDLVKRKMKGMEGNMCFAFSVTEDGVSF